MIPLRNPLPWGPFTSVGTHAEFASDDSKFVPSGFDPGPNAPGLYVPVQWSVDAIIEGVLKYDVPRRALPDREVEQIESWLFRMYAPYMNAPMVAPWQALALLKRDKAAGIGYRHYGPLKGHVIDALGEKFHAVMLEDFKTKRHIMTSTLKDELRIVGKLPRLFMPVNICLAYVGLLLYSGMDQKLADCFGKHPICIGMSMPGGGINYVYNALNEFSPNIVAFDANRWDASFPLVLAYVVGRFRAAFLNAEVQGLHERYYRMVYEGLVSVLGNVLHIPNQRSGQILTASDNSLVQSACLFLHAIRQGMSFDEFVRDVRFFCMGDDLIIADRSGKFTAASVARTYNSLGIYLECHATEYHDLASSSFCGTVPVWREFRGNSFLLPLGRTDKLLDSMRWMHKRGTVCDFVQKAVSILVLVFPDKEVYE